MLSWLPQLTKGWKGCLMGWVLKWGSRLSTSVGSRWSERSYIMWKNPHEKGVVKNREREREQCSILNYFNIQLWLIYNNFGLLRLKIHWHQYLLFALDCLLIQHWLLPNSLRPSSLTHTLQINCIGLIGPRLHTFWAWAPNCAPTMHVFWINFFNVCVYIYIYIYILVIYLSILLSILLIRGFPCFVFNF